jgi:two-component system response regulator EvgA
LYLYETHTIMLPPPPANSEHKKVVIVDDAPHYVYVIQKKLERTCNCNVVATYASGIPFLEQCTNFHFDLVILDFELPHFSGLETFYRLRKLLPDVPVLFLSQFQFKEYFEEACRNPNTAFVSKQATNELCQQVVHLFDTGYLVQKTALSDAELEMLLLICNETDNAGIALKFNTSEETIKKRKLHLAQKLSITNHPTSFLKWALRNGVYQLS